MKIKLPRGIVVDINNIPENFDRMICEAFKDYTKGTNPKFMYQDKLAFIDACAYYLHGEMDGEDAVKGLIMRNTKWRLDEYGDLPGYEDFWDIGFMSECYSQGKKDAKLYDHYTGDRRTDDKIMEVLYRAIKVVMDYDGAKMDKED